MTNTRTQASASRDVLTVSEVGDEQLGNGDGLRRVEGAVCTVRQAIEPGETPPGALETGDFTGGGNVVKVRPKDAIAFAS